MPLPWNKSIELYVGAHQVCGTLHPAWYRHDVLARAGHLVEQSFMTTDDAAPLGAIDAVLSDLRASAPSGAVDLNVVMSDKHIHYDVVAGNYRHASERQLDSIASACVAELLADLAVGQLVRWQLQPDQRHLLICSIALQYIEAIAEASLRQGLSLASLQPEFCAQWNRHAIAAHSGTTVFATANCAQVTVACVEGDAITAVSGGLFHGNEACPEENLCATSGLDSRVNRLVASIGVDIRTVSTFTLVVRDITVHRLDPRWTVVDAQKKEPL